MELARYIQIIRRRIWIVIIMTVVVVEVVAVGSSLMTPIYSASTLLRVATFQNSTIEYFPMDYSDRLMNTNMQMLISRPFLAEVISRLSLETSPGDLKKQILIESVPNTELLRISADATDPIMAADIARTLGDLLIEQREGLFSGFGKSAQESLEEQLTIIETDLQENRARLQELLGDTTGINQSNIIEQLSTRIQIQEGTYTLLLNEYDRARVTEGLRANSITIIEPAIPPMAPSKPNIFMNSLFGGVLGLTGGIALVFLLDNLDTRIDTTDDLEAATDIPLMGWIPNIPRLDKSQDGRLIVKNNARSPASESFRILRSNIFDSQPDTQPKTLLITSAEPNAGKSTIIANIAVSLAHTTQSVLVVDADFGRPSLHDVFGLQNESGLSDILLDIRLIDEVIQETKFQGLSVLTTGLLSGDPTKLLKAQNLRQVISRLSEDFKIILLDSSPLLAAADAAIIAPIVDAVLLVAARSQSSDQSLEKALRQLELVGANVIGTVLNKANIRPGEYYFSEYHSGKQKRRSILGFLRRRKNLQGEKK